jgi:hypothetical protein
VRGKREVVQGPCQVVLLALALTTTACFPVMTPPLKGDGGYAFRLGGDSGYRFSAGTDVASLIPNEQFPLFAGGGYVQTSTVYGKSRTPVHGLYLEGGPKVVGGSFWRIFAGPRLEYYFAPRGADPAYAGIVRTTIELFGASMPGKEPKDTSTGGGWWGIAFGMFALGAYLEGGYQHLPNDAGYPLVGGGLLLRAPATAGLVCCVWDFTPKTH